MSAWARISLRNFAELYCHLESAALSDVKGDRKRPPEIFKLVVASPNRFQAASLSGLVRCWAAHWPALSG